MALYFGIFAILVGIIIILFRSSIVKKLYKHPGTPGITKPMYIKHGITKMRKVAVIIGVTIIILGIFIILDFHINFPWTIWIIALLWLLFTGHTLGKKRID